MKPSQKSEEEMREVLVRPGLRPITPSISRAGV